MKDFSHVQELNARELLKWEKELLGFYLSGRPVDRYRRAFEGQNLMKIADLIDPGLAKPEALRVAGEVTDLRKITTRKGELMAVLSLEDWHDSAGVIEVVLFPRTYAKALDAFAERYAADPLRPQELGRGRNCADQRPLRRKPRRSPRSSPTLSASTSPLRSRWMLGPSRIMTLSRLGLPKRTSRQTRS